jgi:hypothetical protein
LETQLKDLKVRQVIRHQVLPEQKDRQVLLVIKDQLHLQVRKELKDRKGIRVLKDLLVTHHKVHRDHKVTHLRGLRVVVEIRDHRVVQVIPPKDLLVQQDLVDLAGIKDLQEIRVPKVRKDQLHLQDHRVLKDLKVLRDQKVLRVTHLSVTKEVKDLVVLRVDKVMQHKVLLDLRVILHQVLQVQKDQQALLVIKDRLHLQDLQVQKDLRVTKDLRVRLVRHQKDPKDLRVVQ